MPVITQPETGQKFHVGGRVRPPRRYAPKMRLSNYLLANLPLPPPKVTYALNGWSAIKDGYLNNQVGDCVVAGAAHLIGVWTGNAKHGQPTLFSDDVIKRAYHGFSNGQYPDQDSGCDEEFAWNYWKANGFADDPKHKLLCWLWVDAGNPIEVRQAIYLFEGVLSGVEMPTEWIQPGPAGNHFVFDVAGPPNPELGHCMSHFGYNEQGIGCATWGLYGVVTWAAVGKYFTTSANGMLATAVSLDMLDRATQRAPNGLNITQLVSDAQSFQH